MRKMKDSSVEWIGQIPEEWAIYPMKAILNERNEKNDPIVTDNILSLTVEQGVIPYGEKKSAGGNKPKEDLSKYRLAYPGDIVINSMNVLAGAVDISKYFGAVSPVYYTLYSSDSIYMASYYNLLFQTKPFQNNLLGLGNGIMMKQTESSGKLNTIRMRIPISKLITLCLPVPPVNEQKAVITYLNEKVAHIDNIIDKTKQTIEEYKKYKQSLITEAVTKGLNPDVKMKDSGVEWIGQIPEHWEVNKYKYFLKINNGKEVENEVDVNYENAYPVYGSGGIFKYSDKALYSGEAILFGRKGSIGKVLHVTSSFWTVDTMFYSSVKDDVNGRFFYYSLISIPWNYFTTQTALPSIVGSEIANISVGIPPLSEQQMISTYLDEVVLKSDNLIDQKQKIISNLEAYKKSLIYEVVTGKREVC